MSDGITRSWAAPEVQIDFRLLYETAPVAFLVLAPDRPRFTIIAASDAYLRVTKTTRDIIGRGIFDVFPDDPDDPGSTGGPARASFERVLDTGAHDAMAVQKHSIPRPAAEGGGFEERYWSPVNTPVLGRDGKVLYVHHRVEDVTEFVRQKQKGLEQEAAAAALRTRAGEMEADVLRRAQELQELNRDLRSANHRLAELDRARERRSQEQTALLYAISDTSDDAIFAKDRDGRLRFANPATLALIGKRLEDVLDHTDAEFLDDVAAARQVMENDRRIIASGISEDVEERVRSPDGAERVWLSRKVPYRDQRGSVVGLLGISRDITDRKRGEEALRASEQRLGLAFDAGRAAAWEVNLVTRKHFWEDRFFPLLGVPSEKREWAEQHWTEFVLPEDRERSAQEFLAACAEGGPRYDSEFRARRMDGVVRWFRSRGVEIRDARGGRRMVGFVQDITEQKDAEQTLRESNERLHDTDRRKDEFLSAASHELRTPLATLRIQTDTLSRLFSDGRADQARVRRKLDGMGMQLDRLQQLMNTLLDVTRISAGRLRLERQRCDLALLAADAVERFEDPAERAGVELSLDAAPALGSWDPVRIDQIMTNLLDNALKHAPGSR
ncbi:MAG: PAS domain-containing protein, partial [Anaeromyxobacteraceae bacterium]